MWPDDVWILLIIWKKIKDWTPFLNKQKKLEDCNILFIDDNEHEFDIIEILRNTRAYSSVESLSDLDHLENSYLKLADVIFLDIQWIWKKMHLKNWTELVDQILEKYPKKIIAIYSSKWIPKDSMIKKNLRIIPKSSDHSVFNDFIKDVWL